ncbi:MAG: CapA family protein [Clostridiaceae bacterium]|nr:CapA family protein [Clostridiaceae bacterium]
MVIKKFTKHSVLSKKFIVLIVVLCLVFIFPGCSKKNSESKDNIQSNSEANIEQNITQTATDSDSNQNTVSQNEPNDTSVGITQNTLSLELLAEKANQDLSASFTIGMIGDVLFHDWLIAGGLQEDGTYDYPYIYEYLEPDVKNLDFAMFNMEGTLAGPPYAGYPCFSAPSELANSMAEKGFNLATTASNHSVDRGVEGMYATIESLRSAGLENLGTRKEGDPPYFSTELNGIKVAISTATYTTPKINGLVSLNGIPVPAEVEHLIDTFSLEEAYMYDDMAKLQERARIMREDGNEVVIFIMHWGTEYSLQEDWFQSLYAQALADAGVDMVFGMHPHVVEPIKTVKSEDGKHNMLVYYSLGNSVSDQDYYTADMMGHCQDGLMGIVTFVRDKDGEISIGECGYMATYCNMIKVAADASQSQVIPVKRALQNPEAYGIYDISLIQGSAERTANIMSNNTIEGLELKEYDSVPVFKFESAD